MKVLCIGDSIIKGRSGVNFVRLLQQELPACTFKNCGMDGDTFNHISTRLIKELKAHPDYDCIVLQGGYNDIFLPYFKRKGWLFSFALQQQLKKGLKPIEDTSTFEAQLRSTIRAVKGVYKGRLIITTLGCINEFLPFELNRKRAAYNEIIRQVAKNEGVQLADCALFFDKALQQAQQTNYFLESFWAVTLFDPIVSAFKKGPDFLSRKRKLHLTIDGVHLNTKGAAIYKTCIAEQLNASQQIPAQQVAYKLHEL